MKLTVDNKLRITDPIPEFINWCKKNLILPNPEYKKKVQMNLWTGNTPKELVLYERDGNDFLLPYGCMGDVIDRFYDLMDSDPVCTIPPSTPVLFSCDVPLYGYQETAVKAMINAYNGILQSPAGSGKTQMGIAIAAVLQRKTLWLTHTADLLDQSKERAKLYMDESLIGTITAGQVNIGKITFATIQTMCKLDLSQYKYFWDVIIVDECHRVAGTPTSMSMFSKVLNALGARHKYGLSATVHRADGMIRATYALIGNVAYIVPESAVADKIMKVSIRPRLTDVKSSIDYLNTDGTLNYTKLVTWLTDDVPRNAMILGDLIQNYKHSNLILSDRIEQLKMLYRALPQTGKTDLFNSAVMIDGSMTSKAAKEKRKKAIEDMKSGKKHFLFASYSLAKEGLDIPCLDRLYLTTPHKDYAVVTQCVGRIARTADGKEAPVVYDYVDSKIPYLLKSYKERCRSYRKLGCDFLEE